MLLTLDAGNSFIKLAVWDQDAIIRRDRLAVANIDDLQEHLSQLPADIEQVMAATVLDAESNKKLATMCQQSGLPPMTVLTAKDSFAGLSHSYPEPARHGSDRWAALIGAISLYQPPLCVIDAGTAITVDLLDADKHYAGGMIMPGEVLMTGALLEGTAGIGQTSDHAPVFASNTADQVAAGCRLAALAGIDAAITAARNKLGEGCVVICTGGRATSHSITNPAADCVIEPDLVMIGLHCAAGQN